MAKAFGGSSLGVFHALWATGQAPPNRLLGLLQQGWMQAGKLGDLADKVEGLGKTLAPSMQFTKYLPGDLAQLEFGGKP